MYNNDFRKLQSERILSIYGMQSPGQADEQINKSEIDVEVVLSNTSDFIEEVDVVEKSEALSVLESLATNNIEKAEQDSDSKLEEQVKNSKETAPNDLKKEADEKDGKDKEDTVEDEDKPEKKIKKGIDDLIQKGEISNAIAYGYGSGNEPFKFQKTGKEIKEKLPSVISALSIEKGVLLSKMATIATQIGITPAIQNNSKYSGLTPEIDFSTYPWEMCDAPYDDISRKRLDPTEQNLLCSQYNSLCSLCRSVCEDIATAQVIMANVEEKKQYTLSVNQLIALAFTDAQIQKSEGNAFTAVGTNDFVNSQMKRIADCYHIEKVEEGAVSE